MEAFLDFWINNNQALATWIFFACLILVSYLLYRGLNQPAAEAEVQVKKSDIDLDELKETLKSVISQTQVHLASAPPAHPAPPSHPNDSVKPEESAVETGAPPTAEPAAAPDSPSAETIGVQISYAGESVDKGPRQGSEDLKEYLEKIEDLEGRLAEYEILEDDIADLSLFKEENAKLKTELANLKALLKDKDLAEEQDPQASEGQDEQPDEQPEEEGLAHEPSEDDEILKKFAEAAVSDAQKQASMEADSSQEQEPSQEVSPNAATSEDNAETEEIQVDQDAEILKQFAESLGSDEKGPEENSDQAPEDKPGVEAKKEQVAPEAQDDILAEFIDEIGGVEPAGEVNTDKMLAEVEDLGSNQEAKLEDNVDTDKMADEARKLLEDQ